MRQDNAVSLMEAAYQKLKDMLFEQEIVPGQKLIYRELIDLLNMSSTPVQLALGRLEQEGFVERIPHVGFYVRRLSLKERDDLFDLRRIIEVSAVELAIQNQTPREIRTLEELANRHAHYFVQVYDRKKLLLDIEFHKHICIMSGNTEYCNQLKRIFDHIYLRTRLDLMPTGRLSIAVSQHAEILKRIKENNIRGAQKYLDKHLRDAKEANRRSVLSGTHGLQ